MKIKKLTATFGKLNGDTLELGDGLNIIKAPNESGKSTWCAFIRAMLYGINTSERDKQGFLSDKNKYSPWSGSPMGGTMEITHNGENITISRANLGTSPMKKFSAFYTGTANPVPGFDGTTAGEILTGASNKVFDRTAFIRQAGIRVDQTSELEKRISALVSSGGEIRSFSEAEGNLKTWIRKYRAPRGGGSIQKLEEEKEDMEKKYFALQAKTASLSDLRQSTLRTKAAKERLEEELELHKKIEKRSRLRSLKEAIAKENKADEEIAALTEALSVNGHVPTKDEISDIRAKYSTMESLNVLFMQSLEGEQNAAISLESAENSLKDHRFSEYFGNDAETKAAYIAGYEKPAEILPETAPLKSKSKGIYFILASVCLILGIVLSIYSSKMIPVSLGFAAAAAVLLFLGSKKDSSTQPAPIPIPTPDPMEVYYSAFGVEGLDELKALAAEYLEAHRLCQKSKAEYRAAKQSFENSKNSVKAAENLLLSATKTVFKEEIDPYSVIQPLRDIEGKIELLTKAKFEKLSSCNVKETLSENLSDDVNVSENDFLPVPMYSYQRTASEHEKAERDYEDLVRSYNIAYGELKALGDPVVILSEISRLDEEIKKQTEVLDALSLAYKALEDANTELQTRFSPVISKKAGEYMSVLTGGRYSDIVFDKAFNAMAKSSEEAVSRSILSLSEGTADQIYLALRLAMSSLILDGDDPSPLILDDALVNFDNARTMHALRLLRKMSSERQIILFTCHDRELEFAKNNPSVHTIVFEE